VVTNVRTRQQLTVTPSTTEQTGVLSFLSIAAAQSYDEILEISFDLT
jgi:hypothetical protein